MELQHWAHDLFLEIGASEGLAKDLTLGLDILIILLVSVVADIVARRVIMRIVHRIVQRTKNDWDDIFYEQKVFKALGHILPALIISYSTDFVLGDFPKVLELIDEWVFIYIIVMISLTVSRTLRATQHIAQRSSYFEGKPVASFMQLFTIVNYIVAAVLILSQLIGKSPLTVLGAFGAGTAVLLLIFRDTILGLVASIQLSMNDMVRLGDWISMEKYGADGDVIEINLTTVKVKNWDKTITTIPTYAFVSDSFKNWRGMSNSGVRRIKRHILIDTNSIRFVDEPLLEKVKRYQIVRQYVDQRLKEINDYNEKNQVDKSSNINGRHMTNIGVFRQYAAEYIKRHPLVNDQETLMVRQLQPTETGLPLEIYCFSSTTAWVAYEGIMSDIFDHLLAAAPHFEIAIFQSPSGSDFSQLAGVSNLERTSERPQQLTTGTKGKVAPEG